jgi:hypothetical protein
MKKCFLLLMILCGTITVTSAQTGQSFPLLTGKTLTDKTITIPKDTKGKYTLIGMAYSRKSEESLKGWFQPVYTAFIDKNRSMWETTSAYDLNIYFIPLISGIKEAAAGTIEKKLKEGLDKELQPYVLLYTGKMDEYRQKLNFDGKEKAYFFVLDNNGKIVYTTSGDYSEKKMQEIEDMLEEN